MIHSLSEPEAAAEAREKKKPVTYPCDAELRAQVLTLILTGQITQADLCAEIGYSAAALSLYFSKDGNKYNAGVKNFEGALREWLKDRAKVLSTGVKTIHCDVSHQIETAFEDIRTSRDMGSVIGEPGIGKTRGIEMYLRGRSLAILIECWLGMRALNDLMNEMFEKADVARPKRGQNPIQRLFKAMRGTTRLFIFDDAHKLSRQGLQLIFDFRDKTGAAIALVGTPKLIEKLTDDGQRSRRTGALHPLKLKQPRELIDHLIEQIVPEAGAETKALAMLCEQVAAHEGIFGSVEKQLKRSRRIKAGEPDWSWCKCFAAAHKRLIRNYDLEGGTK